MKCSQRKGKHWQYKKHFKKHFGRQKASGGAALDQNSSQSYNPSFPKGREKNIYCGHDIPITIRNPWDTMAPRPTKVGLRFRTQNQGLGKSQQRNHCWPCWPTVFSVPTAHRPTPQPSKEKEGNLEETETIF